MRNIGAKIVGSDLRSTFGNHLNQPEGNVKVAGLLFSSDRQMDYSENAEPVGLHMALIKGWQEVWGRDKTPDCQNWRF